MKRKENFQLLPKELHQLKYEATSVPQGLVRLVKKTQERKSSTCYLLITKGVTSSSPVPLKTRRESSTVRQAKSYCSSSRYRDGLQSRTETITAEKLQSCTAVHWESPAATQKRQSANTFEKLGTQQMPLGYTANKN
ncbi:uncharacterized protein TNCV_1961961 [Trichonephila clavipes]|nr:uncharacterized protein TNCV_1961961 [Trichonephila clavipes]